MKIGFFDCNACISENLILASILNCGMGKTLLINTLLDAGIRNFDLEINKLSIAQVNGTVVNVRTNIIKKISYNDIINTISNSRLTLAQKDKIQKIFSLLHEVDENKLWNYSDFVIVSSIVVALQLMEIEKLYASPLRVSWGFSENEKDIQLRPSPAEIKIIQKRRIPIFSQGNNIKLNTVTGIAVLAICADFSFLPSLVISKVGHGIIQDNEKKVYLLRFLLGEKFEDKNIVHKHDRYQEVMTDIKIRDAVLIETNIDDMNPEYYNYIMENLYNNGALDVYFQPIQMKKNRPGNILSVIAHHKDIEKLNIIIFRETSSIGVRIIPISKYMLPYEKIIVKTYFGNISVKVAKFNNSITNIAPEYEDCKRVALENKVPLKVIYQSAVSAVKRQLKI